MQIFLEASDFSEVRQAYEIGIITGAMIDLASVAKSGQTLIHALREWLQLPDLLVHTQVGSLDARGMVDEAAPLCALSDNVVIKVPMTMEGLKATREFSRRGVKTCMALVYSVNQALLAACVEATFISSYVGALDDIGHNGVQLIKEIHTALEMCGASAQLLASDLRDSAQVSRAMLAGADIVCIRWTVLEQMIKHPLTDQGIERFLTEWSSESVSEEG